jgi:hypothetical protein
MSSDVARVHYEIPDDLHRKAKAAAAMQGLTLRTFVIEEALRQASRAEGDEDEPDHLVTSSRRTTAQGHRQPTHTNGNRQVTRPIGGICAGGSCGRLFQRQVTLGTALSGAHVRDRGSWRRITGPRISHGPAATRL